jgi:hypothetical protein
MRVTLNPASARITSRSSKLGRRPPFAPHPKLHMGFAEGAGQLLDLGLQVLLPGAGAVAGAAGERSAAAVQELVPPGSDRGLRDPLTAGRLLDRHLAAQHRQHDTQLLLDRLDR